jgi:hypothetical protein
MEKIKIPRHPAFKDFGIFKTIGNTYVCPGWHEVPDGTTREDILLVDDYLPIKKEDVIETTEKPSKDLRFEALSSKGDKKYIVTYMKGEWDCSCPARTFFKGPCKHIKKFK